LFRDGATSDNGGERKIGRLKEKEAVPTLFKRFLKEVGENEVYSLNHPKLSN